MNEAYISQADLHRLNVAVRQCALRKPAWDFWVDPVDATSHPGKGVRPFVLICARPVQHRDFPYSHYGSLELDEFKGKQVDDLLEKVSNAIMEGMRRWCEWHIPGCKKRPPSD
ncbi:hypothetical protein [Nitrospira sp. BLG_1]|uniref:hypothetical protein n=1 Tax=Nitrospira sp. BLG_1 TaxID=3395883 RepID=UPI0039BD91E6